MPSGAFRALRPIILASSSPRRRELLGSLGIDFTIKVVDGSEPPPRWKTIPPPMPCGRRKPRPKP